MADDSQDTQDPTPASVTAPALRIGDETPAPGSQPGKPLEAGGQGKALVRTAYPLDSFEHGVKGIPVVTAAGIEVDRSDAKKLLKAADEAGIELEEVDNA